MDMIIPNEGKLLLIALCFAAGASTEDFVVDLYQNNYTPVDSSTGSSFTVSSFTGYAQVAVARSTFGTATIVSNVANITSSVSPAYACSAGGGQLAYGWYVRGASSGKVYAAAAFSVAVNMAAGATLTLTPFTIQLKSIP